jgi:hypothetical protein
VPWYSYYIKSHLLNFFLSRNLGQNFSYSRQRPGTITTSNHYLLTFQNFGQNPLYTRSERTRLFFTKTSQRPRIIDYYINSVSADFSDLLDNIYSGQHPLTHSTFSKVSVLVYLLLVYLTHSTFSKVSVLVYLLPASHFLSIYLSI